MQYRASIQDVATWSRRFLHQSAALEELVVTFARCKLSDNNSLAQEAVVTLTSH